MKVWLLFTGLVFVVGTVANAKCFADKDRLTFADVINIVDFKDCEKDELTAAENTALQYAKLKLLLVKESEQALGQAATDQNRTNLKNAQATFTDAKSSLALIRATLLGR